MRHTSFKDFRLPAGNRASRRVFHIITWTAAVVFALFWLVGYDTPYVENSNFAAPVFTDVLMVFAALILAVALALTVWAVARSLKLAGRGGRIVNNIPVKKIAYSTVAAVVAVLVLTFAFGSSDMIFINGKEYTDTLWLRTADMFVSSALLLVAAGIVIIIGATVANGRRE